MTFYFMCFILVLIMVIGLIIDKPVPLTPMNKLTYALMLLFAPLIVLLFISITITEIRKGFQ